MTAVAQSDYSMTGALLVISVMALLTASRERLTVAELEEQARQREIASLEDVRLAVLETNDQINYIPTDG